MNKKEQAVCQKIYEENHERIRWYLWKHYSWMKEDDVFDIMQDVWKELSQHISKVAKRSEAGQWAWLVTVANSKVVSLLRANTRDDKLAEKVQKFCNQKPERNPVQESVILKTLAESVLEKLTPEERELLFREYFDSEDPKKEGPAKRKDNAFVCKTYRARKKLQKHMKEGELYE